MHTIFFYYSALHPHVAGLILARGGSRGIPLKNVTLLKDTPLLAWSLSAMRTFRSFDSLWVSTGVNTGNLSISLLVTWKERDRFLSWKVLVESQNVRNFSYPVRIRWIKSSNLLLGLEYKSRGFSQKLRPGELLHGHDFVNLQQILIGFWGMLSIGI